MGATRRGGPPSAAAVVLPLPQQQTPYTSAPPHAAPHGSSVVSRSSIEGGALGTSALTSASASTDWFEDPLSTLTGAVQGEVDADLDMTRVSSLQD